MLSAARLNGAARLRAASRRLFRCAAASGGGPVPPASAARRALVAAPRAGRSAVASARENASPRGGGGAARRAAEQSFAAAAAGAVSKAKLRKTNPYFLWRDMKAAAVKAHKDSGTAIPAEFNGEWAQPAADVKAYYQEQAKAKDLASASAAGASGAGEVKGGASGAGAADDGSSGGSEEAGEEEPVLSPAFCELKLRRFERQVARTEFRLEAAQAELLKKVAPAEDAEAYWEVELAMYNMLGARCERAGDAAAAQRYYAEVREAGKGLLIAQRTLAGLRNDSTEALAVQNTTAELDYLRRSYKLLREYAAEHYGEERAATMVAPVVQDLTDTSASYFEYEMRVRKETRAWRDVQKKKAAAPPE